jgi:hypothetical protein
MSAMWQTTIPWCAVIVRNSFGVAGAAHRNQSRYCMRYAWPSGRWGSLPLEGGIEAAYRAISTRPPIPRRRWRRSRTRSTSCRSPFRSAGDVLDRGDRRSARHAPAALRVRESDGAAQASGPSTFGMRG